MSGQLPFTVVSENEVSRRTLQPDGLAGFEEISKANGVRQHPGTPPRATVARKAVGHYRDIIGRDDRVPFYTLNHPYFHIGTLNSGKKWSTATAISERHIVCAYHGISLDFRGHIERSYFSPCSNNLPNQIKNPFGRYRVSKAYFVGAPNRSDDSLNYNGIDFAILELERPLAMEISFGFPGLFKFDRRATGQPLWLHVGYPNDYAVPIIQNPVTVTGASFVFFRDVSGISIPGYILFSDVDGKEGQSGGPIFQLFDDGFGQFTINMVGVLSYGNGTRTGFAGFADTFFALWDAVQRDSSVIT